MKCKFVDFILLYAVVLFVVTIVGALTLQFVPGFTPKDFLNIFDLIAHCSLVITSGLAIWAMKVSRKK